MTEIKTTVNEITKGVFVFKIEVDGELEDIGYKKIEDENTFRFENTIEISGPTKDVVFK